VTGTSTTIDGLAPETDYVVSVTATNRGGEGGTSAPVTFTTLTADGITRLAGDDRYETAATIALNRFDPADVSTVYLATGTNFPDALAGGPLAAANDSPVLLVQPTTLPDVVADALATLHPSEVVALGGEVAVGQAVLDAAAAAAGGASTDRLSGPDRYATAVAIAQALGGSPTTVFLATGTNFPDALAGGPATGGAPILLSDPGSLSPATADALTDLAPTRVVALGGNAALSDDVLLDAAAAAGGADTSRLFGIDRYATGVDVAHTLGAVDVVYVAVGTKFPDALAAGPAATTEGAPIVLTVPDALPDTVRTYINDLPALRRVVVLGGPAVMSQAVADDLATLLD
jgi:putative cell wall-binding protein